MGWLNKRRSIFAALLGVLVLTGFLINLLVWGYFRLVAGKPWHELGRRNLRAYIDLAVKDLGSPPQEAKARAFAEKTRFHIRYEGPQGSFSTDPSLASVSDYRLSCRKERNLGWKQGAAFAISDTAQGSLVFVSDPANLASLRSEARVLLVLLILCVIACAWLAIRHLLSPLKDLEDGLAAVGEGRLDHRIQVHRRDELGRLGDNFNAMAGRLKGLLEARRQLLLDVSHELRTPLTRMMLELEGMKGPKAEGLKFDAAQIEGMVRELLEGESLESGGLHLEDLDLAALARAVAGEFKGRKPGIRAAGLPKSMDWRGDGPRLGTALRNLLDNSIKYSPRKAKAVELGLSLQRGRPEFTVRDHGPGIPEAFRDRVFEPFYRLDRSRARAAGAVNGYGLGLSLVKKIAEAHGGSVKLEAAPGGGTLAYLRL